ncbi:uncharacterized protein PG998_012297 [Apiospora kogelbergensis]|uniref:uncharacterized protein n=1 Tax=Apiospora kogelbergensis TaxID=1337665 RepID=UPI00312F0E27
MVTPSTSRRDELKTKYPIASAEREAEATYESHNGSDGAEGGESVQTIIIDIGNSPERDAEENTPQAWTFFVRPSRTDVFENVYLILYPTSEQYPVTVIQQDTPYYRVPCQSWGSFRIDVVLLLKDEYSWISGDEENSRVLTLDWTLNFERFDGRGSMRRYRGSLDKTRYRTTMKWRAMIVNPPGHEAELQIIWWTLWVVCDVKHILVYHRFRE